MLTGSSFTDEVSALSAANACLDGWVARHNRRFAVAPSDALDAPVPSKLDAAKYRQLFLV